MSKKSHHHRHHRRPESKPESDSGGVEEKSPRSPRSVPSLANSQRSVPTLAGPPSASGRTSTGLLIPTITTTSIPSGLESLVNVDKILIKQQLELVEIFCGCETNNEYEIRSSFGQDLFHAKEDNDCCTRNICGHIRPFHMKLKDLTDREIIHLHRPCGCGSCWYPCCLQSINVFSPPGNLIGRVKQKWTLCCPKYRVLNPQGEVVLNINGPCCTTSCCCSDVEFKIVGPDGGAPVGKISKKWSGLAKEFFTDADNFGIAFSRDLDVRTKATLIGACILIDYMYFESKQKKKPG